MLEPGDVILLLAAQDQVTRRRLHTDLASRNAPARVTRLIPPARFFEGQRPAPPADGKLLTPRYKRLYAPRCTFTPQPA
jgi:hypothetical protein